MAFHYRKVINYGLFVKKTTMMFSYRKFIKVYNQTVAFFALNNNVLLQKSSTMIFRITKISTKTFSYGKVINDGHFVKQAFRIEKLLAIIFLCIEMLSWVISKIRLSSSSIRFSYRSRQRWSLLTENISKKNILYESH